MAQETAAALRTVRNSGVGVSPVTPESYGAPGSSLVWHILDDQSSKRLDASPNGS